MPTPVKSVPLMADILFSLQRDRKRGSFGGIYVCGCETKDKQEIRRAHQWTIRAVGVHTRGPAAGMA